MVREHPKRDLGDAKKSITTEGKFYIRDERLLSLGLKGKTVGLVWEKRA
jgi:hypothetical protein